MREEIDNLWPSWSKIQVSFFAELPRVGEISVDLVFQAFALPSDNEFDGPEDTVVSEMIKQLP